eukprot:TRINITY_DN571_c1_g1_i3.p1 TRINITY_DN571_c1_g1~~TRINITY_DN571_c1_g1_i3.p1  ORF type:complete len:387 (+),score=121.64 TRINITY_DN571_c1_g1_i3:40-1161(+)
MAAISTKKQKNTVWCWGSNRDAQCGVADLKSQLIPIRLKQGKIPGEIIDVSAGSSFSAVLNDKGQVYTWGNGKSGRLGYPADRTTIPKLVPLPESIKITQISCGTFHVAALTDDGRVVTWGHNRPHGGGLGRGIDKSESPAIVENIPAVASVTAGNNRTLCLTTNKELWVLGSFLGNGEDGLPWKVSLENDPPIDHVSTGVNHMLILTGGKVYVWGNSAEGALGLGKKKDERLVPTIIPELEEIQEVGCSVSEHHTHSLALSRDGQVYTWGEGYKAKLGHGDMEDQLRPKMIANLSEISHLAAGGIHNTLLTSDGQVLTFGCGSDGRLGHPECQGHRYLYKEDRPRAIDALYGMKVMRLSTSYYHSIALVRAT